MYLNSGETVEWKFSSEVEESFEYWNKLSNPTAAERNTIVRYNKTLLDFISGRLVQCVSSLAKSLSVSIYDEEIIISPEIIAKNLQSRLKRECVFYRFTSHGLSTFNYRFLRKLNVGP
jgi:hypothetical protein